MATIRDVALLRLAREDGTAWNIVRVGTDRPGLYGLGSASDVFNPEAVAAALETRIAPFLVGRSTDAIEETWQLLYQSGYWRNGSVLTTAVGAVDVALWDIAGKECGKPLYHLLGGAVRREVPCYGHAEGADLPALLEHAAALVAQGYGTVRVQLGGYGGGGFATDGTGGRYFSEEAYLDAIPRMLAACRERFGGGVGLCHDVHSHLSPAAAVTLAKLVEIYHPFFLEDLLPPEHLSWYRNIRATTTTPQAVGELFTNPAEWMPLITDRLIDFIRARVSKVGGVSRAVRLAHVAEAFGVRTAWQEGYDNDPVNWAAALHVDMATMSFGIQEENHFTQREHAAFPGTPVVTGGGAAPGAGPGLGVTLDAASARRLERVAPAAGLWWEADRARDGTPIRP